MSNIETQSSSENTHITELLDRDEKGKAIQSNYNCQLVLRKDPLFKGAIRFNELTQKIDICRELGWKRDSINITDTDLDNIITYMETFYGLKLDKNIERAVRVIANENSYHPIREKLLSLKWDGVQRLPYALHHFLGVGYLAWSQLDIPGLGSVSCSIVLAVDTAW